MAARNTHQEAKAGTIWVNGYIVFNNTAPFGRFNSSGIGRELGEYAQATTRN